MMRKTMSDDYNTKAKRGMMGVKNGDVIMEKPDNPTKGSMISSCDSCNKAYRRVIHPTEGTMCPYCFSETPKSFMAA